ncbi:MAG TPA: 3-dehydroquinate synthase, partial [Thermoanaerobaculia bacterium]|nr:3-dehydroquinate synthase [Thermoanaerobaculia bacterium]
LNLGHTLGHALESALAYRGLRHGEAVAYGLLFALRLAETRGYERAEPALFARTRRLVGALGLPPLPAEGLDPGHLVDLATRDKKARRSGMVWVLPEALGEGRAVGRMVDDLEPTELVGEVTSFLADPFAGRPG